MASRHAAYEASTGYREVMISLRKVSKVYPGGVGAVEDLSIEIQLGETLVLLGSSGCGKTTTLKLINRLVERTAGSILIEGQDVSSLDPVLLRRKIGYVFQGIGLFPHWTVAENVAAIPKLLGWPDRQIQDRVDALLNDVGLPPQDYRFRYPAELSGGQQQRVGVARALAAETRILLMDEPFGAVDPVTREGLQQQIKMLQERLGLTIVLVTHDVNEALLLADRLAVMDAGQLLQVGSPRELSNHPADPRVGSLLAMPRRQADRLQSIIGTDMIADGRNEEP
ncbi:ATP-binding cassette domain-containing protein [Myxococcota bacterium]|nr:ATP-binding cassette domain-containing protein [Myxococcota bacterium]